MSTLEQILEAVRRAEKASPTTYTTALQDMKRMSEEDRSMLGNEGQLANVLTDREALVLSSRAKGETLEAVAKRIGKTRERARQIENKAWRKLKYLSRRLPDDKAD